MRDPLPAGTGRRLAWWLLLAPIIVLLPGCNPFRRAPFGQLRAIVRDTAIQRPSTDAQVRISRAGRFVEPRVNASLRRGDSIQTGPNVRAIVNFRDGYQVILGPSSDLVILNPSIRLSRGKAYTSRTHTQPRSRHPFTAKTKWASTGVAGTEFMITTADSGSLVAVVTGRAEVTPTGQPGQTLLVRELEEVFVFADSAAGQPFVRPLRPEVRDSIRQLVPDTLGLRLITLFGGVSRAPAVDSVTVPAVTGQPLGRAAAVLARGRLQASPEPLSPDTPWIVVRQEPTAETRAAAGSSVRLTVQPPRPTEGMPQPEPSAPLSRTSDLVERLDVNFASGSATLLPQALPVLDLLARLMADLPLARLEVTGHADGIGTDSYNDSLSAARASAVVEYLHARHEIDPARLHAGALGESRPIADNTTPTGRAANRRVSFRLLLPGGTAAH